MKSIFTSFFFLGSLPLIFPPQVSSIDSFSLPDMVTSNAAVIDKTSSVNVSAGQLK